MANILSFRSNLLLLFFAGLFTLSVCTPDCYNFTEGITKKWNGYTEPLPPNLKGLRVDWMTIKPGKNCAFYTFSDIYFASFHPGVQGIYLNFLNQSSTVTSGAPCTLESTKINTLNSGTWLYANSFSAPKNICGYYVGVANSDSQE
mgnify:CR=1 FL=1